MPFHRNVYLKESFILLVLGKVEKFTSIATFGMCKQPISPLKIFQWWLKSRLITASSGFQPPLICL